MTDLNLPSLRLRVRAHHFSTYAPGMRLRNSPCACRAPHGGPALTALCGLLAAVDDAPSDVLRVLALGTFRDAMKVSVAFNESAVNALLAEAISRVQTVHLTHAADTHVLRAVCACGLPDGGPHGGPLCEDLSHLIASAQKAVVYPDEWLALYADLEARIASLGPAPL